MHTCAQIVSDHSRVVLGLAPEFLCSGYDAGQTRQVLDQVPIMNALANIKPSTAAFCGLIDVTSRLVQLC